MQEKHNETGGDIEQTETAIVPSPVPTSVPEKEASKMNSDQYAIFLKYWGMGSERSLDKLAQVLQEEAHQKGTQPAPKTPAHDTLKKWSGRFKWQELIQQMDEEANQKLFEEAIEAARQTRVDIMKIFRAVVLRFATQLKQNPTREMSTGDVVAFWRMARLEMGLSDGSGGSSNAPPAHGEIRPIAGFIYEVPAGAQVEFPEKPPQPIHVEHTEITGDGATDPAAPATDAKTA